MIAFAAIAIACVANAAAVGWSLATGSATYADNAYDFFVIGQNGVASIDTVTALLDAGTSVGSYAFASGSVGSTGTAMTAAASSGKSLGEGTYTSFFVLFDSATPTAGSSKYAVVSGAGTLTKTVGTSTASVTFTSGSAASILGVSSNWKPFGAATPVPGPEPVPEPTSGLLVLLGMAGLALKRKRA